MSEEPVPYGLPRARLTSQGQITVPKAVRDALGAKPGDEILFEQRGDEVVLRHRRRPGIMDLAGIFADTVMVPFPNKAEWRRIIEDEVAARHEALMARLAPDDLAGDGGEAHEGGG